MLRRLHLVWRLMPKKIEIYTDVEGVMTADPRIVKDATILHKISYAEVAQMAQQGGEGYSSARGGNCHAQEHSAGC